MVIRYGAELLIDNCLKILFLIVLGFMLGKGFESIIFLFVFCSLRTQAGGFHAKTSWGCGLCMAVVWGIGILGSEMIEISLYGVLVLAFALALIIIWKAPKTINRHCYTFEAVRRAKAYAIAILCVYAIVAAIYIDWRSLIMCAVTMEVMTLLPKH